jgi:DNA-binding protein YbaB
MFRRPVGIDRRDGAHAMSDDPVDRLGDLADEADSYAQRIAAAQAAAAAEEVTGSDVTGAVTIDIGPSGVVRAVRVRQDWRQHIGVEELGGAVVEAMQAAITSRLGAFAQILDEQESEPDPVPKPRPVSDSFAARFTEVIDRAPSTEAGTAALNELGTLLEEINNSIDEVTAVVEQFAGSTVQGRSRGGHVTATVSTAGAVVGITYDKRWLVNAHEYNIGRETVAAIRAAYEQAGRQTIGDVIAKSRFGQLAALADDPLGLAWRLHLRSD